MITVVINHPRHLKWIINSNGPLHAGTLCYSVGACRTTWFYQNLVPVEFERGTEEAII
jgi:hypothetical protein